MSSSQEKIDLAAFILSTMDTTTKPPRLNPNEVSQYRKDGYLIFNHPVLPEEKF